MTDEQTTGWSKNTDSTLNPVPSAESSTAPSRRLPGRKRRSWVWIVVGILIILAVAGIRLFQNRSQPQSARTIAALAPPPLMIATSAAQKGDIGIYVNALGVVTPINTVMVKSRVDGQLMSVNYVDGQMVHAGSSLVVITQLQPITVIFSIAEDYLPQVQQQLRAGKTLAVDAFDRAQTKKLATGTLQTLDNQIDTTTGTLKLKAVFTNEDESLFPNQFVNARLLVDTLHNATLVPNTVIQRNAESAFVYLLKPDQTVAMLTITVATTDGNASAVEGIKPGAVVAADNFNRLTDGAKVTVRKPSNEGSVERRSVERTGRSPAERSDAPTLQRSHAPTPTRS